MRHHGRASLTLCFLAVLLAVVAPVLFAGECPLATTGNNYRDDFKSAANLPRCSNGTIGKWSTCEVCAISNAGYSDERQPYLASYYPASGTALQPRATFTQSANSTSFTVDGFFDGLTSDGKAIFRIRFTPSVNSGNIHFNALSPDDGLKISGDFTASNPAASDKGFLRRDPAYPRTFVWDDGSHPFLWGQTFYQIVNLARAGRDNLWQTAITNSLGKKLNKVRLLVSPWAGDTRYANADSKAFKKNDGSLTLDRNRLDIDHWRALDKVTGFLDSNAMVADLILFHDGGETQSPFAPGNTQASILQNQRYTRYTAARYAAFTNVIWTLANEYQLITGTSPAGNEPWNNLGCVIRGCGIHSPAADPWIRNDTFWRPLSNHNNINTSTTNGKPVNMSYPCFEFFDTNWRAHVAAQTKRAARIDEEAAAAVLRNSLGASPNPCDALVAANLKLPVVNDEYYYIGEDADDRNRHRLASWAVAASGGYGSTGNVVGSFPPTLYTEWVESTDQYRDLTNLIDYFTGSVNGLSDRWWQMTALQSPALLTGSQGARVYGMTGTDAQALNYYVVYAVSTGTNPKAKINVKVPKGSYTYTFKDPTDVTAGGFTDKRATQRTKFVQFVSNARAGWKDFVAKIVQTSTSPSKAVAAEDETAWVWDELPAGAVTGGNSEDWNWVDDEPPAISDSLAHTSNSVPGLMHQHFFQNASETLPVAAGDWLYAYIYLEPQDSPSEVMLQWNDGNWEHRAYWGANQIALGINGTDSRRYMGPLPLPGRWVRLEVPASAVGLGGHTLNGMAFTLFGGKATWDEAGRANRSVPQCEESSITQQPQSSQTIIPGASATLSVAVTGTGPFNYQFYQAPVGGYQNPTGISTATINTGPIYTTKEYWAEINDTCQGTFLRSDAAIVIVQCTAAPTITQQPTSRVTTPGQFTTLSVSSYQGVSYQWYQGSAPIAGATNPTLSVNPQSTTVYWVRVTNGCGTADSVNATVCVLPAITAQPTPRTINPGQSTTLTVSAVNAASYQWYVGTAPSTATPILGATNSAVAVAPAATTNYWVRVFNSCGTFDSNTVTVTVAPPPPAQIARMQSVSVLANSQQSITARWTQPTQAGTFLVAVISGLKDPAQLQWTAPAGWQLAVSEEWPNVKLAIYYMANNAGARASETFTAAVGFHDMTLYVAEYSGVMAVNPLDRTGSSGDYTNSGYVQTGFTANTVQPKELVITGLSTYTQTEFSVTPADGYTELYDQYMLYHLTTAMYEKITTSIGSYGHGASVYVPAEWVGVVATFRAANTN
ncbi:MAG: hypothetical protein ACJ74H_20355 [Thermoanaerobaculia bacterium]